MKQLSVLMIAGLCGALMMAGCATGGSADPSAAIAKQVKGFVGALKAEDLDAVMALVSENFKHYEYQNKAGLKDFLSQAIDMGYLEDVESDIEGMEVKMEGVKGTAYPVELSGAFGTATLELEFTQEDAGWMITGMDVSGV